MNIVYYRYSSKIIGVMYIRENKEWNFRVDVKLFEN